MPNNTGSTSNDYDGQKGVISKAEIYNLAAFKKRVGWSDHAMRTARRRGLRVVRPAGGKTAFIRGEDFDRWIADQVDRR